MSARIASLCRSCSALCPIVVTVEGGRAIRVQGDPAAPLYGGYTCIKGRSLPDQMYGAGRLLRSLKRGPDGGYAPIPAGRALDEVAERIRTIVAEHGPRSIALYYGTGVTSFIHVATVAHAFMKAIGSPMTFSVNTIDKPGAAIAEARHGKWAAGHPGFEEADAWLVIGSNPVISKSGGIPVNNPAMRLKEAVAGRQMKLIVIDPRVTETTRRAHLHLRGRPGEDPAILASIIHVILRDRLYDAAFVAAHVGGVEALGAAVSPFDPGHVSERAGLPVAQIEEAARIISAARYCGSFCGTGSSFATHSSLSEYLALCIASLCGHWARAGDRAAKVNALLPAFIPKAQAIAPIPVKGFGEKLRVRGLEMTVSGMPCAALADEILMEGDGKVRALIVLGGNPMMAFPEQDRTHAALRSLDLLVTADFEMTATARLSDYVLAPRLPLETPGTSYVLEMLKYLGHSRGLDQPYARYAPAAVDPPAGSDLIEDWEIFYELAKRLGLPLELDGVYGIGPFAEAAARRVVLDMTDKPTTDELLEQLLADARIPLETVKMFDHGHVFDLDIRVAPADPGNDARLDVGNDAMMRELASVRAAPVGPDAAFPFLLLPRRLNHVVNSQGRDNPALRRIEPGNPTGIHSDDLAQLGLHDGEMIVLRSRHGEVRSIARADDSLLPGTVSLSHCFGLNPGEAGDVATDGASVARLLSVNDAFDADTGIPRMGALPVSITSARPN